MRSRRDHWLKAGTATVVLALLVVGAVVAQDPAPNPAPAPADAKGAAPGKEPDKAKATRKGRLLRAPGREPGKGAPKAANPLANAVNAEGAVIAPGAPLPNLGTFHYRFKISVSNSVPISAAYYPSKSGTNSPVVMLVHQRERSSKDFEESIAELKKYTFAEQLQKQGYAVLALDLRGHGASPPRRTLAKAEWPAVVTDIQVGFFCLVDRHNWGELNVARLGVVALGEGANVASAWAAMGGGVSSAGRTSDLGSLVLVSPMINDQSQGVFAKPSVTALAARVPLALLIGERDTASAGLVDDGPASVKSIVKRYQSNKVETFPSALHGYKLLQFEPNLTGSIFNFLDSTIKSKADMWDGRYLLTPVTYTEVKMIKNPVRTEAAAKKAAN